MTIGLTEAKINEVLLAFYVKVRTAPVLSVPFWVVQGWDENMVRLTDFWSSLMLTSGHYKGNPLSMHVIHSQLVRPDMFDRWLELWGEMTNDLHAPEVALEMQAKAVRIASRFKSALFGASTRSTTTR
jgi:hemoglobin